MVDPITTVAADNYWVVGGDESRVYATARAQYVPATDATYLAWLASGSIPSRAAAQADMIEALRANGVPPYHRVRKSTIIARLTDAQLAQAIGMLSVRQQERWRAPDQPAVNADDPETIAVLRAVGADPVAALAPE